MKRTNKRLGFLMITALLCVALLVPAFAQGTVNFDANTKDFIFAPGSENSPTDLFEGFKDVMPGDTLTEKITIKNDESKDVKIKLYIRSLGAVEGSEELLGQMKLTVKQVGNETPLFEAPANETAQLTDWVYLGTVFSGGTVDLELTLEVSEDMGNDFIDKIGYIDWEFKADELPVEPDDPKPPQTNDNTRTILYVVLAVVSAAVIVAVLISFKKKKVNA